MTGDYKRAQARGHQGGDTPSGTDLEILILGEPPIRDTLARLYFPCCLQVDAIFFRPRSFRPSRRATSKTTRIPRRPVPFRLSPTQFPASHASFAAANRRPLLNRHANAAT
jgi:hypothetical protein